MAVAPYHAASHIHPIPIPPALLQASSSFSFTRIGADVCIRSATAAAAATTTAGSYDDEGGWKNDDINNSDSITTNKKFKDGGPSSYNNDADGRRPLKKEPSQKGSGGARGRVLKILSGKDYTVDDVLGVLDDVQVADFLKSFRGEGYVKGLFR